MHNLIRGELLDLTRLSIDQDVPMTPVVLDDPTVGPTTRLDVTPDEGSLDRQSGDGSELAS